MQKRQPHNKSRRGCSQCKNGHIKCDEGRPACKRCIGRGQDCDYSPSRHLRRLKTQTAITGGSPLTSGSRGDSPSCVRDGNDAYGSIYYANESFTLHPPSPSSKPQHTLELHLLNAFTSGADAMNSIYPNGHHVNVSIKTILQLAASHNYLKDILLGCTAMSLRSRNPLDQNLVEASHTYALRSIQACSAQIRNGVNENNAEGLFVSALLLAVHSFIGREYDARVEDNYSMTGQMPSLRWLRQFQGVRAIRVAGWSWLQNSPYIKPMIPDFPTTTVAQGGSIRTPFFSHLLEGLDYEETNSEDLEAYRLPVAYLSDVINDHTRHGLLGFPISTSERFLELLEILDPRSMTIIGSYLALLRLSRRADSLICAAQRDFQFIMEHLPVEWLPRMNWARDVFSGMMTTENDW